MAVITGSESSDTRLVAITAVRAGAVVLAVSALANLVVLVVGRLAGADMSVIRAGTTQPMEVGVVLVLLTTAAPLLLGTAALAVVARRGSRGWAALAWAGLALGVVSVAMPFGVEATTSTRLTLASMHVIVGVVWFAVLRRGLRSAAT